METQQNSVAREAQPEAQSADEPISTVDSASICDRIARPELDITGLERVVDITKRYHGNVALDCRVSRFAVDISYSEIPEVSNQVVGLIAALWGCEGYALPENYIPQEDFPLTHPDWSVTQDDVLALIDVFLKFIVDESGFVFSPSELESFEETLLELAEGAHTSDEEGLSRSVCGLEGLGGAAGLGGSGG